MDVRTSGVSRRAVAKGAAWSIPVVATAVAAPQAAASPGAPVVGNYYWNPSAQADDIQLTPAAGGNVATFSAQISYLSEPYVAPPPGALVVTLDFTDDRSAPATVELVDLITGQWEQIAPTGTRGSSFTFRLSPAGQAGSLSARIHDSSGGVLNVRATMSWIDDDASDGQAAGTDSPASTSATLVA